MRHVYTGKRKTLVLAIMMAGSALPLAAQEPEIEEVIVTGSLIRGTPLDAALPVEVFSAAELQETGSPTALDFAKTLTAGGPITGEAYYFGGSGNTGNVSFNLRGIGSDKTLTLFNGRFSLPVLGYQSDRNPQGRRGSDLRGRCHRWSREFYY